MRRELKAEFAKEAFDKAMAKFQAECPVIEKKKKVAFNTTNYSYAPLDEIVGQVKGIISGNGFSYTFDTEQTERAIKVFCKVKHELGHSESSKFEIEIDTAAKMNKSQQYGSALTYGKRYAFCDAFGILTGDEDDDAIASGNSAPTKRATPYKQPKLSDITLDFIKALEEATTVEEYHELYEAIKQANDTKAISPAEFKALIAAAKNAVARIQESLKPKPQHEPVVVEEEEAEPKEESDFAKAVKQTKGAKFVS
jgi:hypothetical protein